MIDRVEVAVGGVAVRDGAILLIERATEPAVGKWSVPGGRVEPGETLADALVREMAEETGLAVAVGPMIAIAERIGRSHHVVIVNHHVEVVGPTEPVAGDDAADAAWTPLDRLAEIDLVPGLLDHLTEHGIVN